MHLFDIIFPFMPDSRRFKSRHIEKNGSEPLSMNKSLDS